MVAGVSSARRRAREARSVSLRKDQYRTRSSQRARDGGRPGIDSARSRSLRRLDGGFPRTGGLADAGVGQEQKQLAPIFRHPPPLLRAEPEPGGIPFPIRILRRAEQGESPLAGGDPLAQVVLHLQASVDEAERLQDARVVIVEQVARPSVGQLRAGRRQRRADRQQDQDRPDGHSGRGGQPRVPAGELPRLLHAAQLGGVLQWAVLQEPAQVVGQMVGLLVPPGRVRCQALAGDALQAPGEIRPIPTDRRDRLAPLHSHRLDLHGKSGVAPALVERAVAREHLGQHHSQRIDVRTAIHLADQCRRAADQGAEVLRGHVGHGPADRRVRRVVILGLSEVEVEEQRLPLGTDEDVGRLDVAVEDAPLMGMVQSLGKLRHDPGRRALVAHRPQEGQGNRPVRL